MATRLKPCSHFHSPYSLRSTGILLVRLIALRQRIGEVNGVTDEPAKLRSERTRNPEKRPRRDRDLKVPVLPEEEAAIKALAQQARRPVARYLREVGLGYKLHSVVDLEAVRELAKVNGDLGRLGGLLKLWLGGDARTARFTPATVEVLLDRIASQQDELGRVMHEILKRRRGA